MKVNSDDRMGNMAVKRTNDKPVKKTPGGTNTKKKSSLKSRWPVLLCVALGILVGVIAGIALIEAPPAAEKVFVVEDLRITLTEDFAAFENDRFTGVLVSRDVGVTILKESFTQVPGSESLSLEEYGHLMISTNGIGGTMLCTEYGLTYFEFTRENPEDGEVFGYFAAVYKTKDAFWLVQMGVPKQDYSQWRETLEAYARSVVFE